MYYFKRILIILLTISLIIESGRTVTAKEKDTEVRAVWVSFFDYESAGLSNKTKAVFKKNAATMFTNIKKNGCNTVYFHVRSYNDAIYPSKTFKWSKYMTSGKNPHYDPLKILVSEAHKKGLKFHAWINPYRVTADKILNPGKKATIKRIVKGVKEIINKYNVDGIHFDDYFYPAPSHKQSKKYKSVSAKKRKANVNKMIRSVYKCIKKHNKKIQFGISPAGTTSYCKYIGADVKTWLSKRGYVDYVVPQIYWTNCYKLNGKTTKMFSNRLAEWNSLNKRRIPMYIGLALYRVGSKNALDLGWKKSSANIVEQIRLLRNAGNKGFVLFSYYSMFRKQASKEMTNYRSQLLNN